MSRQNKNSLKTAKAWQRHALAQACFLVAAGLSTAAMAQVLTPGAAMFATDPILSPLTQGVGDYWSTGYNQKNELYQFGSGQVNGTLGANTLFSNLTGGVMPVNIANNSLMVYSYGNQNAGVSILLNSLVGASPSNDGALALNLQIFSATALDGGEGGPGTYSPRSVLASVANNGPYITQADMGSANLNLSGVTVAATLALNTVGTTLSGATPFGYSSTTKGASLITIGEGSNSTGTIASPNEANSTRGTTGSVNISNLQSTFNAFGTATLSDSSAKITVSDTTPIGVATVGVLSNNISLNSNTLKASNTNNEASSIVNASASSSAFTGSVSVTNIQATRITDDSVQMASVTDGNVQTDLRNGVTATQLTGTLNLNDNVVMAQSMGNTAGARNSAGAIAAGNAIVFDGAADITGTTAPLALGTSGATHLSMIDNVSANGTADLVVNTLQRNTANTFTASVDTSLTSSKMDMINGGTVNQTGNQQTATATANLAGNLITAGASGSIGNIVANAAIVNTQANTATTVLADVTDSSQTVTVGTAYSLASLTNSTLNGIVNLNDNSLSATAEGNVAASTLNLRATNLTVGGNGSSQVLLVPAQSGANPAASAGSAASVLSLQRNGGLTMTANNEGNAVGVSFNTQALPSASTMNINASQVSVNDNSLLSTATGNSASNALTLTATNAPGLNASVGNGQLIDAASTINANAGFADALAVSITVNAVAASQLSMKNNTQSATATGNSASNSLAATVTTASGLTSGVSGGAFYGGGTVPGSRASDVADGSSTAVGVQANADFMLANAQANNGSTLTAVLEGSSKITTTTVGTASTLSANNNSLTASSAVNGASNAVTLNIANMTGMTAGISSGQSALNSVATATTTAEVSLNTGEVSGASGLNLTQNTVSASVSGNAVSNNFNLTSTTASGRDLNIGGGFNQSLAGSALGMAMVAADFALSNNQKISNSPSANFNAAVTSGTKAITGQVGDSSVTVDSNNTLATASGNTATNAMVMAVTTLTKPNTGLSSLQTLNGASFNATIEDTLLSAGGTGVVAGAVTSAQIAVTGNLTQATAQGNVATNSMALSGTNVTGANDDFPGSLVSSNVGNNETGVRANLAMSNLQTSTGNGMSALLGDGATLKIGLTTDAVITSTLALTGNSLSSRVYNNSATNTLTVTETNINNLSVGLASGQSVTAILSVPNWTALTASTDGQIMVSTGAVSSNSALTLSGNDVKSLVIGNTAANSLGVNATTATGRNWASDDRQANATGRSASADFALVSEQVFTAASDLSASSTGNIQILSAAVTASPVTLDQNTLSAYTSANNVNNQLNLATTNLTEATAGLANQQLLNDSAQVSATVEDALVKVGAGAVLSSALTVSNNTVKATALGNLATNQLNLTGTNATAGAGNGNGTSNAINDTTYVDAGLALANNQTSNDTLVAATNGTTGDRTYVQLNTGSVGRNIGGTTSALSLTGNSVASLGYTNNATNSMALTVTNLNGLTAGVASNQYANADALTVTERATASTVGQISTTTDGAAVTGGSSVTVGGNAAAAGNALSASSNVNYASNSLQITGGQITGANLSKPNTYANVDTKGYALSDLTLANSQSVLGNVVSGNVLDFASATVEGVVKANVGDVNTAATVNVSNNSVSSYTSGNNAGNAMAVSATGLNTASLGLASAQSLDSGNVIAETIGEVSVTALALNAATVSLNNNQIKSMAVANVATNALSVTASNASGTTFAPVPVGTTSVGISPSATAQGDLSMSNSQQVKSATVLATTDEVTSYTVVQSFGSLTAAQTSMNANAVTASAYGNSATNALTVAATNLTNMSMASANLQGVITGSLVKAETTGQVQSNVGAITGTSSVAINENQVAATSLANIATNTLSVTATSATGRAASPSASLATNTQNANFNLLNAQVLNNSSAVADTSGSVYFDNSGAVTDSQVSMNSNAVTSYASANQASNVLDLQVGNLSEATAGLSSVQNLLAISGAQANTTGFELVSAGAISNSLLSLNSNQAKSTALGNLATNQLTLTGTSAQGVSSGLGANSVTADSTSADISLSNKQNSDIGIFATASTGAPSGGQFNVEMSVAAVSSGAALTVNSNSLSATSYLNSASNTLGLAVTNLTALNAAVNNVQSAQGGINLPYSNPFSSSAEVYGLVQMAVAGAVDTASLAVNNNLMGSTAYANSANNSLSVAGTTVSGRGLNASSTATLASAAGSVITADYALGNNQEMANGSVSAATTGAVYLNATSVDVDASTLNLNTNNVLASATGSSAINNLAIAATTLTQASAAVASIQTAGSNGPSVTATVMGAVSLTTGDVGDSSASYLTVKDNNLKATALGNVMGNALTVSASTLTPGGSGSTLSRQIMGGAESNADFSIVSDQNMLGPVSATATGEVSIYTAAVTDSTLSLTGNSLKSLAQANSISNDLTITATQQNSVTASVVSHQGDSDGEFNTATATTAPVGLGALRIVTEGLNNVSVAITGNTISAVAGKNEVFNTLTVSGSNILGRNGTVAGLAVGTASATGADFSVINEQLTNTAVTATLDTGASGFVTSGAFVGGTMSLSDNTVAATANANTASNTLTLAATNRLEASGVINNVQSTTGTGVAIGATVTGALNVETSSTAGNASVAVAGNVVKASASANQRRLRDRAREWHGDADLRRVELAINRPGHQRVGNDQRFHHGRGPIERCVEQRWHGQCDG
jgi:hypothetical protein